MVRLLSTRLIISIKTDKIKLSKDEEATAAGGEENEVRREDQEKINRFSRLHQRESVLEELLQGKNVRSFFSSSLLFILVTICSVTLYIYICIISMSQTHGT